MGNLQSTFDAFTILMEFAYDEYGSVAVVIQGAYDLDCIPVLDHTMYAGTLKNGVFALLRQEDGVIDVDDLLTAVRTYYYMTQGDIISSEHQPYLLNVEGLVTEELVIETSEHGIIGITCVGGVEYEEEDDYYEIFTANPQPGVYLVVILELIGEKPDLYRRVDMKDDTHWNGVIQAFLEQEGLTDDEDEDEEDFSTSDY